MSGAAAMVDSGIPHSEVVSILRAEYLKPAEVAAVLKVSRKTLADWRLEGRGPSFMLQPRGIVVYPAENFRRFLRALPQKDSREGVSRR